MAEANLVIGGMDMSVKFPRVLAVLLATALLVLTLTACVEIIENGDTKWKMYVKSGVYEDPDTYIPTLNDFGEYVGLVDDATVLIDEEDEYENSVVGFRTWVYVSEATSINIGLDGDDGVALYLNGEPVCSKPNAEDPMVYGTMELTKGWNKVEALVYNGPLDISLKFDKKLSDFVDQMNANPPE